MAEVTSETVPAIERAMGPEGDRVAMRMQRGCRCFAAWAGPDVAGYGWVSTTGEWIGELALEIKPAPGEAYLWNCVTLGTHRRKGVFTALLRSVKAQLQAQGSSRIWIGSVEDPAENGVNGAGFVPVLRFDASSRLGVRWLRIRPAYRVDPSLLKAADRSVTGRGVPFGSGFFLGRSETRVH